MEESRVYARALNAAAARAGGLDQLARQLGVPVTRINGWIDGEGAPDTPTLLRIVAIALDEET
jgi:DNA-binding phage protein